MSKRVSQYTSNTVDTNEVLKVKQDKEFQSISEVSEQSIIMILDNINENQKKLMKSRSERYKDAQKILENSIRLNNKLILDTSQDATRKQRPPDKHFTSGNNKTTTGL